MPFVENDGVEIYYTEEGRRTQEPLVLLHWFMGSHHTWYDVGWVKELNPHFRLILIDHRGYGQSSKPHDPEAYRSEHHVSDILAVLKDIGVDRTHLFGYSMGARIGMAMVSQAAQYVSSLVAGGMHPYEASRVPTDLDRRIDLLERGLKHTLDAYNIGPKTVYNRMMENDVDALLADTRQTQQWTDISSSLRGFNKPMLLYVGREDGFYDGVKEFSQYLDSARLVVFTGENHRTAFIKRHLLKPHLSRFYGIEF